MSTIALRPGSAIQNINWGKVMAFVAILAIAMIALIEPAFAFSEFESKVTTQTKAATDVAQKVLLTAAVLALIVGFAPMLWGQVKVKWIVTGCIACVMFGLAGALVSAFSS